MASIDSGEEAFTDILSTMAQGPGGPPAYVIFLREFNKYLINVLLVFIMVAMGCVVTVQDFKVVLRRPIGAAIGLGCQFILLPLIAFALAHILRLEPAHALGMLILASCPGGATSNLLTYLSSGDVCLSIVMTTISTIAALGTLPFNLWLYSRQWTTSTKTAIPYTNISIALVLIIVPVAIGMLVRWKSTKIAQAITLIGSIAGFVMIFVNLVINCIINPGMFSSPWTLWFSAFLLPCLGYGFGYLIALILCQKWKERRTIAFETGMQNVGVALSLISVTFAESPLFFDLFTYPTIYAFAIVTTSFSLAGIYRLYDKYYPREDEDESRDKMGQETGDAVGLSNPGIVNEA